MNGPKLHRENGEEFYRCSACKTKSDQLFGHKTKEGTEKSSPRYSWLCSKCLQAASGVMLPKPANRNLLWMTTKAESLAEGVLSLVESLATPYENLIGRGWKYDAIVGGYIHPDLPEHVIMPWQMRSGGGASFFKAAPPTYIHKWNGVQVDSLKEEELDPYLDKLHGK